MVRLGLKALAVVAVSAVRPAAFVAVVLAVAMDAQPGLPVAAAKVVPQVFRDDPAVPLAVVAVRVVALRVDAVVVVQRAARGDSLDSTAAVKAKAVWVD
jgi:hypothetical protein